MEITQTYTDGSRHAVWCRGEGGKETLTIQTAEGRNQIGNYQRMLGY